MLNFFIIGAIAAGSLGTVADVSNTRERRSRFFVSWQIAAAQSKNPIGQCWMEDDGTIVLELRRTADGVNVSMPPQRYQPTDPQYEKVRDHVGPLRPGEVKLVMPWPD